jgi:hypothetical protein
VRSGDDEVDPFPDGAALARRRPELAQVGLVERPPREVRERGEHDPGAEAAQELPHDPDRSEQREHGGHGAEDQRPCPAPLEAERPVGEGARGGGDDDQLEDRPAEALADVEHRREVRAAASERRAQEHHRGHARVGADHPRQAEHDVADHAADDDRDDGLRERQRRHEQRAEDDHEQRDAQAAPEEREVDEAEHAQALRDRLDPPVRRVPAQLALPSPA